MHYKTEMSTFGQDLRPIPPNSVEAKVYNAIYKSRALCN